MKKYISQLALGGLLAAGMMCTTGIAQQTGSDTMNKSDNMNSGAMGKKTTAVGCVAEKDGKYMLMNKKHPDGVALMGSEDMKSHVGHKVKVTGTMDKEPMGGEMKSDSMKSDSGMKSDGKTMKSDSMGMMAMSVTSIKMMSDHCEMGGMMNK